MKKLLDFFKSKIFLRNLIFFIILIIASVELVMLGLDRYTHHNEYVEVPDFTGLNLAKCKALALQNKIKVKIIDSVYDPKADKGITIHQDPDKKIKVKQNRTIYLYTTTVLPPQVQMPKLKDKSLKQATALLLTYGLKVGRIKFVPDQCMNCVLEQRLKGRKIEAGALVPKGASVELLVGKGLSDEKVEVPDLIGLTRTQAINKLAENALTEGAVTFEAVKDTIHQKVVKQLPRHTKNATISIGGSIDLFFAIDNDKNDE